MGELTLFVRIHHMQILLNNGFTKKDLLKMNDEQIISTVNTINNLKI